MIHNDFYKSKLSFYFKILNNMTICTLWYTWRERERVIERPGYL